MTGFVKRYVKWFESHRLLSAFIAVILAGVLIYSVFIMRAKSDSQADITSLKNIVFRKTSAVILQSNNQLMLANNAEIDFAPGHVNIRDLSEKGVSIGYDPVEDTPTLLISSDNESGDLLSMIEDGKGIGDIEWEGSTGDHEILFEGEESRARFAIIMEKGPVKNWELRWIGTFPDNAIMDLRTELATSHIIFFPELKTSYGYGSTLSVIMATPGATLPSTVIYADTMYLLVWDAAGSTNMTIYSKDDESNIPQLRLPVDSGSCYLIEYTRDTDTDIRTKLSALPSDAEGRWSFAGETSWGSTPAWSLSFPTITPELPVSIEKCYSEVVTLKASTGNIRVDNEYYELNPLDRLSLVSKNHRDGFNDFRTGETLHLIGTKVEWNKRDYEINSTLAVDSELDALDALVWLNGKNINRTMWSRFPAALQGAIIGMLVTLITNFCLVPYINSFINKRKSEEIYDDYVILALRKRAWSDEQNSYIPDAIKLVDITREASEIGFVRITMQQAEEICNRLKHPVILQNGEKIVNPTVTELVEESEES